MKRIFLTLSMIISSVISSQAQEVVENSVQDVINKYFTTIPLTKGKNAAFFVETEVNGKKRWIVVDSGADSIILDKSIADQDKVKLTPTGNAKGAGTTGSMVYTGQVNSFKIGNKLSLGKPTIHFLDLSNIGTVTFADGSVEKSAGQLGLGFINAVKIAIDYKRNALYINSKPIDGGLASIYEQIGYKGADMIKAKNGRHYVEVSLKGKKAYFLVDTGAGAMVLYRPAAVSLGYALKDSKIKVNTVGKKGMTVQLASVSKMQLGGIAVNGKLEMLAMPHKTPLPKIDGKPVVGILSSTFFEAMGATIDFASSKIMIDPPKK